MDAVEMGMLVMCIATALISIYHNGFANLYSDVGVNCISEEQRKDCSSCTCLGYLTLRPEIL